jgi:hypothetical protein
LLAASGHVGVVGGHGRNNRRSERGEASLMSSVPNRRV